MKKKYASLFVLVFTVISSGFSQDRFSEGFEPIRKDLNDWDPIRGAWLASSMEAISRNEAIPDRTFPEDFTPAEMMRIVPTGNRERIRAIVTENQRNETDPASNTRWNRMEPIVSAPDCKPVTGRSYGDPHMISFDNANYSFQTVGEFVLSRSNNGNFEVQTRQQPQSDDFSLNTAVAMNVGGDRVCLYASNHPDNFTDNPLRVNGAPVRVSNTTYYLPKGGSIRPSRNEYLITWPTGETVNVEMRGSSMPFLNLTVNVYPCNSTFDGLLGNANGLAKDDFDTRSGKSPVYLAFSTFGNDQMQRGSNDAEKEYLAFLAKDYARQFRLTTVNTLFDYGFGQSTFAFTDESFPRVHRTLDDLTPDRRDAARRNCETRGVTGDEMRGCIYDQAYLDIPPSPRPTVVDPTIGYKPPRVDKPIRNVNPVEPMVPKPGTENVVKPAKGTIHPDLLKEPTSPVKPTKDIPAVDKPSKVTDKPSTGNETVKPVEKPTDVIVPASKPPKVITAPAPKPSVPKPAAPKPTLPKPVSPGIKPGKG